MAKNKEMMKIPQKALTLGEGTFTLAAKEEKKPRRCSILALSGQVIPKHWFWGNLALDMSGIKPDSQTMPILRDHKRDRIVGASDFVGVRGGALWAEGTFSQTTPDALEVQALADEGFPWQASVFFVPQKMERVSAGETAEVNGHVLDGPGTIIRSARIREVSFCALGADSHTKAASLSDAEEFDVEISENLTEKEVESMPKEEAGQQVDIQEMVASVSLDQFREARSDIVEALLKEGAEAERTRIKQIREHAFEGMDELADELIESGAPEDEALRKFVAAEKERKGANLAEMEAGAAAQVGGSEDPENLGEGDDTPQKHEYEKAVDAKMLEQNCTRTVAMGLVEKEQPGLREKWLESKKEEK